ncbi:MAG: hypothetical protein DMG35_05695 [Acidobacteria bacterium]|nr:MAG: hypothetical protein DMG35_05695 [Acidobacteriota bacterium]
MKDAAPPAKQEQDANLCATCAHSRSIESPRGSIFVLCELSFNDPRFPKYPRLPVLSCKGYEKAVRG